MKSRNDSPISVKYNGVDIVYNEDTNRWLFELDGKERSAESVANAKKAIDAPPPKDKKPFERFEAYMMDRWSSKVVKVTVTSVAESPAYVSYKQLWVTSPVSREKVSIEKVFEISPFNDSVFDVIKRTKDEISALNEKLENEEKKLVHPVVPD